jgi:penicillin-binding protein 2
MTDGKDVEKIEGYANNKNKPFLERAVDGLYTPGSIVKPFLAVGALEEKIISPTKQLLSIGYISVSNPYNPSQPTIFRDWRVNGWVDMRHALSTSCDTYFYAIGGGYEDPPGQTIIGGKQAGMGIFNIEKYLKAFGLAQPFPKDSFFYSSNTGVIPSPEWKEQTFPEDGAWRLGDTYNSSIGQYGTLVSPMQALRAVSALANDGKLLEPTILKNDTPAKNVDLEFDKTHLQIVREGMRLGATEGSAKAINTPYVQVAVKTGTAELGVKKDFANMWVEGFFPYDNPKYAFVLLMERGPVDSTVGAVAVMRQILDWIGENTPEYFE